MIVSTAILGHHRDGGWLAFNLLVGMVPATVAVALGRPAWSAASGQSSAWSLGGVFVLLAAMVIAGRRGGVF